MSSNARFRFALVALVVADLLAVQSFAQVDPQRALEEMIDKLGGEAFLEARDVVTTGRFYQFQRGELAGGEVFTDYIRFPDQERTEFGRKGELVRINNGNRGWNVTDGTAEPQIPEQIALFWEEFKVSLDYLLREVLPAGKATLQFVGRDMVDFTRVDILEIRDEDRTRINLYVGREDRLLVKKSVRRLDDPQLHEEVYSNYHVLDGILTPLLVSRYTNGVKTMEIRFESVAYNTGLADDLFVVED